MTTVNADRAHSRIALITGANRGIGRATALQLARDGVDVIVTYHSQADEADEVVKSITDTGPSAVALQLDLGATPTASASSSRRYRALCARPGAAGPLTTWWIAEARGDRDPSAMPPKRSSTPSRT